MKSRGRLPVTDGVVVGGQLTAIAPDGLPPYCPNFDVEDDATLVGPSELPSESGLTSVSLPSQGALAAAPSARGADDRGGELSGS